MSTENTHNQDASTEQNPAPAAAPVSGTAAPAEQQESSAAPAAPQFKIEELDEKEQLRALNKMLGTSYKSLDEAKPKAHKTPEDIEAEKSEKDRKALEWAIANGKVSKEQIEKAAVVKAKDKRTIAMDIFRDEYMEQNPKASAEEVEETFKDFYHEHAELTSPTRQVALRHLEKLAEDYISRETTPVDSIGQDYDNHVVSEQRFNGYTSKVKEAVKATPREVTIQVPYKSVDGTDVILDYKMPVDEKTIDAVRKEFAHENTFFALGAHENEVADGQLSSEISAAIEARTFKANFQNVLKEHGERIERDITAKLKAIPATGPSSFNVPKPPVDRGKPIEHSHNRAASAGKLR